MSTPLLRTALSVLAGSAFAAGLFAQSPAAPKLEFPAPSPAAFVKQRVGVTDVEVTYSRPGVKGRRIFGGLVPYDRVWRTGANAATKISFSTAVNLGGSDIPAGEYALYTIPGRDSWTIIINKVTGQWGAYSYDEKNDVARVTAVPVAIAAPVESFTIGFDDLRDDSATLNLVWERTRVPVKLKLDVVGTLVPRIEAALATPGEKAPYAQAAMFYLDNNIDLHKAAAWMDAAIAANPKAFYLTYRKALILEKMGDKAGALAAANLSLEGARQAEGAIRNEYVGLNEALIARLK